MNICRKCGAVLRDGDKFCSKCGARAPSARSEQRRQNAQKRKQEKEITFRTKPARSPGYRENFEEGENRAHALLVTVTILVVMMLVVAAFAMYYFLKRRSQAGGSDYSSSIEILTDSSVQETSAGEPQAQEGTETPALNASQGITILSAEDPEQDAGETQGAEASGETLVQAQSEGPAPDQTQEQSETQEPAGAAVSGETEALTEAMTESQTETEAMTETEISVPSAADVIDPAQIQTILDNESTATSAEVYIYDLRHDSEAALNDCTEPMYASALITVPILYTAAAKIDSGEMSLDDPILYVTSIGGRGELTNEIRDGREFPLSFYLQTMTNYSDNNCINILIDYIGLDTINAVCREAGYTSVNMERGLVAGDPGGLDNYVSAKDITMMVKDLYTGVFSSIGTDYMRTYFHISETDSLPTLVGMAPGLSDASAVLNQNGHGMTRYNETAVIEDNGALYILTIMLHGGSGMVYSPGVTDVAEYVSTVMAG